MEGIVAKETKKSAAETNARWPTSGPRSATGATSTNALVVTVGLGAASHARSEQSFCPAAPMAPQSLLLCGGFCAWRRCIGQMPALQQTGEFVAHSVAASAETDGRTSAISAENATNLRRKFRNRRSPRASILAANAIVQSERLFTAPRIPPDTT